MGQPAASHYVMLDRWTTHDDIVAHYTATSSRRTDTSVATSVNRDLPPHLMDQSVVPPACQHCVVE